MIAYAKSLEHALDNEMKIVTLTNAPLDTATGSGRTVLSYCEGLRKCGSQVIVLEPDHFELMPSLYRGIHLRQAFGALYRGAKVIEREDPDIVECYGAEFSLLAKWVRFRRAASVRPLVVVHTNGLEIAAQKAMQGYVTGCRGIRNVCSKFTNEYLASTMLQSADLLVTLSEYDRDFAISNKLIASDRVAAIPPGLDPIYLGRDAALIRDREEIVGFTGSWVERKGIKILIPVMRALLKTHPSLRFEICGASTQHSEIMQAFESGLSSRITVYPRLSVLEMAEIIERWAVAFHPSLYEGFGLAVAESMASGAVVITTPTGLGWSLSHAKEGIVIPFDSVETMVRLSIEMVTTLLHDREYRITLATAGRRRAQSFIWSEAIKHLDDLYRSRCGPLH